MLPFVPDDKAESAKTKAREAIRKSRRKSWTEVVLKTAWEGGFDEMDEIDEEVEETPMEPVKFDEGYSIGGTATTAAKGGDLNARVHFFADASRKARVANRSGSVASDSGSSMSIEISTPSTPSCYSDDGLAEPAPSPGPRYKPTVPASILLKNSDFVSKGTNVKAGGFRRRASFQPIAKTVTLKKEEPFATGLRLQTTGGREIVLLSSYEVEEAPFDYAIDLENGLTEIRDAGNEGIADGAL